MRRRRSDQLGHVGPVRAFITPALARIALHFPFRFSGFSFTTAQPPSTCHAIAIAATPPSSPALTVVPFANQSRS